MRLPPWIVVVVGVLVLFFGVYRIGLGLRSPADEDSARRRGGLFGLGRRTHILVGVVYILLGGMLLLEAFGVRLVRL